MTMHDSETVERLRLRLEEALDLADQLELSVVAARISSALEQVARTDVA